MMIKQEHWSDEVAYFDAVAQQKELGPIDDAVVRRYRNPSGPWAIDFMFMLAGPLTGMRVLDIGAGCGENSLILAALGADVTALDISPGSLDVLKTRAIASGLRIKTVCSPLEEYTSRERYDIVWCDAFLHHVLPNLPSVLAKLRSLTGRRIIISEPTSPEWLRRLRLRVPISADGTEGERPLYPADLGTIRDALPNIYCKYFRGLSRMIRFAPAPMVKPLAYVDRALLAIPALQQFGSTVVMWGDR